MPTHQLILTIAPERDGKVALWVSLGGADGTRAPPRKIAVDLDRRLGGFVTALEAFARQQLAPVESPAIGGAPDGEPSIAVEAAHGEDVRQRCHAAAT
jgi:hypothetical protein